MLRHSLHTVPFGGKYAMGWVAVSPEQRWHNGSNTMWYAEIIWNEDGRRMRILYGFDGTQPINELPQSKAGLYFGKPFESQYVLIPHKSLRNVTALEHERFKRENPELSSIMGIH